MILFLSSLFIIEPMFAAECKSDAVTVSDFKTISALYTSIDQVITSWLQEREAAITKSFCNLQNPAIMPEVSAQQAMEIVEQQRLLTVIKKMQVTFQANHSLLLLLADLNEEA